MSCRKCWILGHGQRARANSRQVVRGSILFVFGQWGGKGERCRDMGRPGWGRESGSVQLCRSVNEGCRRLSPWEMELCKCWHALCCAFESAHGTKPQKNEPWTIQRQTNLFMVLVPPHFTFCPSSHSSSPLPSCQLEYFDWEQDTETIILCDIWYSGPWRLEMDLVKNMRPAEAPWNVRWEKIRKLDLADSFWVCLESKPENTVINSSYITAVFWV